MIHQGCVALYVAGLLGLIRSQVVVIQHVATILTLMQLTYRVRPSSFTREPNRLFGFPYPHALIGSRVSESILLERIAGMAQIRLSETSVPVKFLMPPYRDRPTQSIHDPVLRHPQQRWTRAAYLSHQQVLSSHLSWEFLLHH